MAHRVHDLRGLSRAPPVHPAAHPRNTSRSVGQKPLPATVAHVVVGPTARASAGGGGGRTGQRGSLRRTKRSDGGDRSIGDEHDLTSGGDVGDAGGRTDAGSPSSDRAGGFADSGRRPSHRDESGREHQHKQRVESRRRGRRVTIWRRRRSGRCNFGRPKTFPVVCRAAG
jgi:hypothetical protein